MPPPPLLTSGPRPTVIAVGRPPLPLAVTATDAVGVPGGVLAVAVAGPLQPLDPAPFTVRTW